MVVCDDIDEDDRDAILVRTLVQNSTKNRLKSPILNIKTSGAQVQIFKALGSQIDGNSQDEISEKFINYLVKNDNEVFFKILSNYTSNKLKNIMENLFETKFISNIVLFFDSIPSYSKILEQRKRRKKNYLESQNR